MSDDNEGLVLAAEAAQGEAFEALDMVDELKAELEAERKRRLRAENVVALIHSRLESSRIDPNLQTCTLGVYELERIDSVLSYNANSSG